LGVVILDLVVVTKLPVAAVLAVPAVAVQL
jgi:hypothetical protein